MRRGTRTIAVGAAVAAAVTLAGCTLPSTPTAEGSASTLAPSASGAPSASPTGSTVDFGEVPENSAAPSCSTLLPAVPAAAVVPGVRATDLLSGTPHIGGTEAFVLAAGGAVCLSSNGVAPLDERWPTRRGDPVYEGVRLTVLPAGREALAQYDAFVGQTAQQPCAASDSARVYCSAEVLAGDAWVSLGTTRVQDDQDATPEQAQPAFDVLLDAVVQRVSSSTLGSADRDGSADDSALTPCSDANVDAATGSDLAVGPFPNSGGPPELEDFARNRVDGDTCVFVGTSGDQLTADALYTHLPAGGWALEQRLAAGTATRSDPLDLPGLGDRDAAWRTCDETACSVDVVRGGDWTHYLLFGRAASDTSAAIERWVRASSV